jgi:hypothetical protein
MIYESARRFRLLELCLALDLILLLSYSSFAFAFILFFILSYSSFIFALVLLLLQLCFAFICSSLIFTPA